MHIGLHTGGGTSWHPNCWWRSVVRKVLEHSSYDAWWQGQAVDKLLGARELTVPTMLVVGQWNQEDSYGAPAVYRALETQDSANDMVSLVIGPWRHS